MPHTTINSVTTAAAGTLLNAAAAVDGTNGNQFANPTGRAIIEITNAAAANINVTFNTVGVATFGGVAYAIADVVGVIANATTKVFGPFDKSLFNDANGNVLVDYTSGTNVSARVLEVGNG